MAASGRSQGLSSASAGLPLLETQAAFNMRYQVLVTDYDGTIAHNGRVDDRTIAAMNKLLASGRRLVMITGRELPELMAVFPHMELFEWVVAENGGVLYRPSTRLKKRLADSPPPEFVRSLQRHHVKPLSVGDVIVATREPKQSIVLRIIHDLGLELQVIFNKGAVMILPAGINKASGLKAALEEMGISYHNAVGVGDAENDHAFLRLCEVSVAVGNALPAIKRTADLVTTGCSGAGVSELIDEMINNDLVALNGKLRRHYIHLGLHGDDPVCISPYGPCLLICGPSASGKSTVATRFVESIQDQKYQFCLIDPEGDYQGLPGAVTFGGPESPPSMDEIVRLLESPTANAVISLTGMPISDRPKQILSLLVQLLHMRSRIGRPHWIILDEAHHLMPAEWRPADSSLPNKLRNVLMITVHPELLAPALLERIDTVMALGTNAQATLAAFGDAIHQPVPRNDFIEPKQGEVLLWQREPAQSSMIVQVLKCRLERQRHRRKYAVGELPAERSFYFRGEDGKMNLRAQNLMMFLQLAEGIDDATWDFHLRRKDYSKWFRECIKDENLAMVAERIEGLMTTPRKSRDLIRCAVEQDYTLPASPPMPVAGAS